MSDAHAAAPPSEEQFRVLAETIPQLVWMTTAEGVHDYYNQRWYDYTGMPYAEAARGEWGRYLHSEDRDRALAAWSRSLATGEPYEIEYRIRRAADGAYRWFIGRALPLRDASGRVVRWFGTSTDVTERKEAEQALHEEAQLVETLQRIGSSLTAELDIARIVQTVTDEATRLTGAQFGAFFYNVVDRKGESYTLYTISGVPREAFSRFPMPRNTHVFDPTFRGTSVVRSDDITKDPRYGKMAPYHGMPEGHLPVVSYLAVPVVSHAGEVMGGLFFGHAQPAVFSARHERLVVGIAGWAAVAMDNARLYASERTARAEAERANKAKSDFLATMSHELRTPLNAIGGYAELMEMGVRGPVTETQKEDLTRIQRAQRHLLSLINDVLNFAKLEAGHVRFDLADVAVHELIAGLDVLVAPQLQGKGIRYECLGCARDLLARADPEKVRQILLNLLSNAIKFTPRGGRIVVDGEAAGRSVVIRVRDSGVGIPPEKLDAIFEPFVQVDRDLTTAHEGTGLGLAISRDLARGMGGDLVAESVLGEGATFVLTLKRAG